jgi:poly(3-hydroxybutyrate) depolymerase
VPEAFDRMRGHGLPSERELQALARGASKHDGPWPTLSIWHGSADNTVAPSNMDAIVGQWRKLHGLEAAPSKTETIDGHSRRVWRDASGREAIEAYSVAGMGHGTPLKVAGDGSLGAAGPFMLDVGISSTLRIARFWGLTAKQTGTLGKTPTASDAQTPIDVNGKNKPQPKRIEVEPKAPRPTGIGKIIDDALRAAGLMR